MENMISGENVFLQATVVGVSLMSNELQLLLLRPKSYEPFLIYADTTLPAFGKESLLLPDMNDITANFRKPCFVCGRVALVQGDILTVSFPGRPLVEVPKRMVPSPEYIKTVLADNHVICDFPVTESDLVYLAQKKLDVDTRDDALVRGLAQRFRNSDVPGIIKEKIRERLDAFCSLDIMREEQKREDIYEGMRFR